MSIELKIKTKHLAQEAKIIRFEEKKLLKRYRAEIKNHYDLGHNESFMPYNSPNYRKFESLSNHRRWDVRNENRATYLARAFLDNKSYVTVEQKRKPEKEDTFLIYVIPRVLTMVNKYGKVQVTKEDILNWCKLE